MRVISIIINKPSLLLLAVMVMVMVANELAEKDGYDFKKKPCCCSN